MPPDSAAHVPETPKKEVDLNTSSRAPIKTLTFKRTKFIAFLILGILLLILSSLGAYFLGQDSVKQDIVAKKEEPKEEEIPDLIEAEMGKEALAKNGIAIELGEAAHDATYEKQKEESKKALEKSASQSAYLDSEYYKQSSLVLKISVKNTTDKVVYYSPSSFRLKDSKDNQYTSGYGYEGGTAQTSNSTLNPSEVTKLSVSYIVPTAEKDFTLIYENVVIDFSLK